MTLRCTTFILLAAALPVPAATLRVGSEEAFSSIQAAVDAAIPGDTIEVGPGLYTENVVIDKSPLILLGAQAGVDARGRVCGVPDSAVESVISPVAGNALNLATPTGAITVSGFSLLASPAGNQGVISADVSAVSTLTLSDNHVKVAPGASGSALHLNQSAIDATILNNVFMAAEDSLQTVVLAGSAIFNGLYFVGNQVLREGAAGHLGLWVDGNRNVGPSSLRNPRIQGNQFAGHAIGLNGGARSLFHAVISGNTFQGNTGGMAAGPQDCTINGNTWSNNSHYGLLLTGFGDPNDSSLGAQGNTVANNWFFNNGTAPAAVFGDLCCDTQATGTQDTNIVRNNRFESPVALNNNDPAATILATYNYWGAQDGPGGHASASGGAILGAGSVTYEPFYADVTMTSLVFGSTSLTGTVTLPNGHSISGSSLSLAPAAILRINEGSRIDVGEMTVPAGASVLIRGGTAVVDKLELQEDAVLDVIDGHLELDPAGDGQYHTISGSFTFFNCLGSLQINGNTNFSGATLGLASDIHVTPGSTMVVLGSLVLDGCRIDSTGSFSLLVNAGAKLVITRCELTGAAISLMGSEVKINDNQFVSSSVTAFSTVNGASIYHNVFNDGLDLLTILPGAVVTTMVEGWGNVSNPASVENEVALQFRPPIEASRTLDSAGNLYVQPNDVLEVGVDIGKLNAKTQAVEALLGYSTDYLSVNGLLPTAGWSNVLYQMADETGVIGKVNAAVGLSFTFPDPDGTTTAGPVADIRMKAKSHEGLTRMFFRTKDVSDHSLIDTRLTVSSDGVSSFKEVPFTRNAATLVVDGTAPEFATGATALQLREAVAVDVLQDGVFTRMGTVTVVFDVVDHLAGIDNADVRAELTGESATLSGTYTGSSTVVIGDVNYTRRVFDFQITATTSDGVYNVNAIAMDRSGNLGRLPVGALEVVKNRISVTVQPEGLVTTPLTREVVFTATNDTGTELASWAVPVAFSGGSGATLLEGLPVGTMFLSAKMAWNLQVREAVPFDAEGLGTAAFTGDRMLPGGDLTGDNIVNLSDYNILRAAFPGTASTPDITGEGVVNLTDYNILRSNWLTAGESP